MNNAFAAHPYRAVINRMTLDDYRNGGPVVTLPPSQYREIREAPAPQERVQ